MVQVDVCVKGAGREDCAELARTTFFAPDGPLKLSDIQQCFPFEGTYHFRYKLHRDDCYQKKGIQLTEEYVWVDLSPSLDAQSVSPPSSSSSAAAKPIELQAILLSPPPISEEEICRADQDYDEYFMDIAMQLQEEGPRQDRQSINESFLTTVAQEKSKDRYKKAFSQAASKMRKGMSTLKGAASKAYGAANVDNLEKVAKGAQSFFKSMLSSAGQMLGVSVPLTDRAAEVLLALAEEVDNNFDDDDERHISILRDLWAILFGHEKSFKRRSDMWKKVGFQKDDPVTDLKNTGMLALICMSYMGRVYREETKEITVKNEKNVKTNYPFAIVGVNVCSLLTELLNLRDCMYLSTQAGYWGIFEDENAFYEIFCIMFFHLDCQWTRKAMIRSQFGELIGELRNLVSRIFERGPRSLQQFKEIGFDEGLMLLADRM